MNLKSLSNTNLVSCFKNFVLNERKITRHVLECIAEIDHRKLYLEMNHTSLFDYLVKDFGYSPGAAMRRIDGARLLMELPDMAEKFERGSLTLSQATQVQRASRELKKTKNEFISTNQKRDLILQIENSSQKQTEQTLAVALDLPIVPTQKEVLHRDQSVTLTLTFTLEQMQLIEQAKNMISHGVPNNNWADVFTYLAKREVARRTTIRASVVSHAKRKSTPVAAHQSEEPAVVAGFGSTLDPVTAVAALKIPNETKDMSGIRVNESRDYSTKKTDMNSLRAPARRALPTETRKKLLHSGAVCEHRYSNGTQCSNRKFLQIDHIHSLSRGGTHDLRNLQVLCGLHNRRKYQQEENLMRSMQILD